MLISEYFGEYRINPWEWIMVPIYFILIFFISSRVKKKNIERFPEYKYYMWGLYAKLIGGLAICLIYVYHYKGGDTIMYYESGVAMVNLLNERPVDFFHVLFGEANETNLFRFDTNTGFVLRYLYYDPKTFFVIKVITPFLWVSFNSYLIATLLLAWVSYMGVWKLYRVFVSIYKDLSFQFAIAILFYPSVVFWGSGMLKDTVTFSASCWLVYAIYHIFIIKKNKFKNTIVLALSAIVVAGIKPYILIAILPGSFSWVFFHRISGIRNRLLKYAAIPVIFLVIIGGTFGIFSLFGQYMDKFALDKILTTAVVTQQDLKQDYYQGNSFDIGEIDPSLGGIIAKAPIAITAGIFRPFIWEAKNAVMAISALENLVILVLGIYLILKVGLRKLIRTILTSPLLLFTISYSMLFAFSVGLTTSNFGALVRFKIPYLPFFMSALFMIFYLNRKKKAVQPAPAIRRQIQPRQRVRPQVVSAPVAE